MLIKACSITPYEAWHNRKPDVSRLRVFGPIAYVHIPKAERRKLEAKSIRCIFVGYSSTQKAFRFWDPSTCTVKISADATFDEHHRLTDVPGEISVTGPPALTTTSRPVHLQVEKDTDKESGHSEVQQHSLDSILPPANSSPESVGQDVQPVQSPEQSLRRSFRGRIPKQD